MIYLAGVVLALWRTDAGWTGRLTLAILGPIGPAAFVATVSLLLGAALIAFPWFGAVVAAAAAAAGWWLLA
jgi:hypothetical protein